MLFLEVVDHPSPNVGKMLSQEERLQLVDLLRVQLLLRQNQRELVMLLQRLPLNDDLSSVGIPFEGVEHLVKPALTMGSTR